VLVVLRRFDPVRVGELAGFEPGDLLDRAVSLGRYRSSRHLAEMRQAAIKACFRSADGVGVTGFFRVPALQRVASPLVVFERDEVGFVAGSLLLGEASGTATAGP
jgi:hypothetical protein